uniref:Uncharacterized protein n=1 Tax=Hanusia phi TaxID=3032 RepID=A0A7S0DXR1_9CRYP|mmetsp:Transcript_12506/g.28741  ORF Transcript_12506/g.28741 Transcript_12506/m.28741 type:complete len:231 (+) Transcript_12506:109-801(+)
MRQGTWSLYLAAPSGLLLLVVTLLATMHTAETQDTYSCCGSVCRTNSLQFCQGVPSCWAWTKGECCRGGCSCRWKTGNLICKVDKKSGEKKDCKVDNSTRDYDGCIDYSDQTRQENSRSSLLFYIIPGAAIIAGAFYLFFMQRNIRRYTTQRRPTRLSRASMTSRRSEYFSANLPEILLQALTAPVRREQIWDESIPPIPFDLYVSGMVLSMQFPVGEGSVRGTEQVQDT